MPRTVSVLAMVLVGAATCASAQSRRGPVVGLGIGFARATMSVGRQSAKAQGLTLHAALGAIELELQPFEVGNPSRAERFAAIGALIGPRLRLSPAFYVRPAIGVQFRLWTGADVVTSRDQGLMIGSVLAFQGQRALGWEFSPQLAWRLAIIEFEGNVRTQQVGVRLQATRAGNDAT